MFFAGMAGTRIPVAVAHGEGRAEFLNGAHLAQAMEPGRVTLKYVDNYGKVASLYPANPNGTPEGITG